jgi:hypothetical protein
MKSVACLFAIAIAAAESGGLNGFECEGPKTDEDADATETGQQSDEQEEPNGLQQRPRVKCMEEQKAQV